MRSGSGDPETAGHERPPPGAARGSSRRPPRSRPPVTRRRPAPGPRRTVRCRAATPARRGRRARRGRAADPTGDVQCPRLRCATAGAVHGRLLPFLAGRSPGEHGERASAVHGRAPVSSRTSATRRAVTDHGASVSRRSCARTAQPRPELTVAQPGPHGGGERLDVAGGHQQSGPRAVGCLTQRLRDPAHRRAPAPAGPAPAPRSPPSRTSRSGRRGGGRPTRHTGCRGRVASRAPTKRSRSAMPCSSVWRTTRRRKVGSRSTAPAHVHRQGRSATCASAAASWSWPLPGTTAATQSSWPPAAVPGARSAPSTPGSATCRRAGSSA